jgi:hypothetical protein
LFGRLIEALLVHFDIEAARQKFCLVFHHLGIAGIHRFHGSQVGIQPGSIQACLVEILRCADKRSRTAAHRIANGGEISAGLRSKKQQHLFCAFRNGYVETLLANFLIPRLGFGKPVLRRRVHRPTQKRDHQHVACAFFFWKIGMNP